MSHRTAAALHGWPVPADGCADVIVPAGHRPRRGLRPHSLDLATSDTVRLAGLTVTSVGRTALDCLGEVAFDEALNLWAWLTSRSLVTHPELVAAVTERQGRPGVAQLRRLAGLTVRGAVSAGEHRLHRLLDAAGLTGWEAGVPIEVDGRVIAVADVLFRSRRLVLEVDGFAAHSIRSAFEQDRRRQNRLVRAGYTVLRFTWPDLTGRPVEVIDDIRVALRATRVPE